jgi:hypothetical protein
MKREKRIIALMACVLLGSGPAIRAQQAVEVELEMPFKLTAGQSAHVSDGFQVTLRTVSDDSGCITPDDCSTMMFKGTLVLRSGENSQLAEIDAGFHADRPFTTDFAGHTVEISAVRHYAKDHIEVAFRVLPAAEPEPDPESD